VSAYTVIELDTTAPTVTLGTLSRLEDLVSINYTVDEPEVVSAIVDRGTSQEALTVNETTLRGEIGVDDGLLIVEAEDDVGNRSVIQTLLSALFAGVPSVVDVTVDEVEQLTPVLSDIEWVQMVLDEVEQLSPKLDVALPADVEVDEGTELDIKLDEDNS
jgi:hypothetical protein